MREAIFPLVGKRVWVAGHKGMVGSAIVRRLASEGCEVLTVDRDRVDLRNGGAVINWMMTAKPDAIFVAAAKVGGIVANEQQPAEFLLDNILIASNVIWAASVWQAAKLLFLGSSCAYPKYAQQPIVEESLLSGFLEQTNEAYAIAKIAGVKLCQAYRRQFGWDFISAMPCNLYGPGDNYDPVHSHVVPALIRKAHEAKTTGERLEVWGTGKPRRELMHVDDCADALVHLMKHYSEDMHINVGTGSDVSINTLVDSVLDTVGIPRCEIAFDHSKPDGTPQKVLDVWRLNDTGWKHKIGLTEGLKSAYADFLERYG